MPLKYQEKLQEYNIENLDDTTLDGAFVSKAKAFEAAIAKGTLSDDQIAATDAELVELFNSSHDFIEVDDTEVAQLKLQNHILSVKEIASKTNDLQELGKLINANSDNQELVDFIQARADKINADQQAAEIERKKEENKKKKAAEPKPTPKLADKLLSQEEWTYDQLKALGINPTGEHMTIEGVRLLRKYLFKIYEVAGKVA